MDKNAVFDSASSIKYAEQAQGILNSMPDKDQEARLLVQFSRVFIFSEQFSKAEEVAEKALEAAVLSENQKTIAHAMVMQAGIARRLNQLDKAEAIFKPAINKIEKLGFDSLKALAHTGLGIVYREKLNYKLALTQFLKVLELYKSKKQTGNISRTYGQLAALYRQMGVYDKMISYQQQSVALAREINDRRGMSIRISNLGTYYKFVEAYDETIAMHQESIEIKRELGYDWGVLHSTNLLGDANRLAGNYDAALYHLKEAQRLEKELIRPAQKAINELYFGRLYMDLSQPELSEQHFKSAVTLLQESGYEYGEVQAYQGLGMLFNLTGQYEEAETYLKKAIDLGLSGDHRRLLLQIYQETALLFENRQDYVRAYDFLGLYTELKSELEAVSSQNRIDALLVEHQVAEQNRTISLLEKENQITALELENQASQKKVIIVTAGFLILLVGLALYLRNKNQQLRIKQSALKQVVQAKDTLDLAMWGSGDELWDWDLTSGTITREHQMPNLALPTGKVGTTLGALKANVHPDDFDAVLVKFNDYLKGDAEYFDANYRVMTKTGDWMWVADRGKVTKRDQNGIALRMSGTLKDISVVKQSELKLAELNETLERRVEERTESLRRSRDTLAETLDELTATQAHLVEAKKMASLGQLVAGVSHELNTPIGTSVTANSLIKDELKGFKDSFNNNKLTRSQTENFVNLSLSSSQLLDKNLRRASELIQRFKSVSVQETTSRIIQFGVEERLSLFVASHSEHNHVIINISCEEGLKINSDPQALLVVLDCLYENSITHGFKGRDTGEIWLNAHKHEDKCIIKYSDNGTGISENHLSQIYEPFFTTNRGGGNVGLGLYVAFTQVVHNLSGEIECQPHETGGVSFTITLPNMTKG